MTVAPKVGDSVETMQGAVGAIVRLGKTIVTIHVREYGLTTALPIRLRDLESRCLDKSCGCCGWKERP